MTTPMRFTAVCILVAMLAPAAQADWPSFHNEARKSGYQSGTEYEVYKDVWWNVRIPKNTTVEASPIIAGGIVIVAGWDKVVRAYDAASGAAKWNYTMTDKVVGTPAVASGRVYAVDVKGSLASLDLKTGRLYAKTDVGATLASVTAHEGKLFIGTEAGEMKAFDVKSSDSVITRLWTFSLASFRPDGGTAECKHSARPIRSAAAVHDGVVYFTAMNNNIYAINAEGESNPTTKLQWFNVTQDLLLASPTVDLTNQRAYFASYDGKVRAFPLDRPSPTTCAGGSRSPAWMYTTPGNAQIRSSPATDGTRIYFGTNTGRVLAITTSGQEAWSMSTGEPVASSPAVANNIVVVGSDDHKVYWLSATNGSVLRSFSAESPIKASPAIDGSRTFVASFDGTIYMFGPQIPARPDLVITAMSASATAISITVKNEGNADSGATSVRILRGGTFLGNVTVNAIAAGQSQTVSFAGAFQPGTVDLRAIVDPEALVAESKESNNELSRKVSVPAPVTEPPASGDGDGDGGGGGLKIPGPGLPLTLALLGLALLAARRRR